jgi:hypothetical protein
MYGRPDAGVVEAADLLERRALGQRWSALLAELGGSLAAPARATALEAVLDRRPSGRHAALRRQLDESMDRRAAAADLTSEPYTAPDMVAALLEHAAQLLQRG